jgi:hypothetical protein
VHIALGDSSFVPAEKGAVVPRSLSPSVDSGVRTPPLRGITRWAIDLNGLELILSAYAELHGMECRRTDAFIQRC